jgi:hypothetical protein
MAHDTKLDGLNDVADAPRTMMPVAQIQASLRESATASVLILDTNFHDVDPPQKDLR